MKKMLFLFSVLCIFLIYISLKFTETSDILTLKERELLVYTEFVKSIPVDTKEVLKTRKDVLKRKTIKHNGIEREYLIYVPKTYSPDKKVPLLFSFHGLEGDMYLNFHYTHFDKIADRENFIVVYPQGTKEVLSTIGKSPVTHWNVGEFTKDSHAKDVEFFSILLDEIEKDYSIDASRIYCAGMSNGGFFVFELACQVGEKIAAVASVTGVMTEDTYINCKLNKPMPILQIHGVNDYIIDYSEVSNVINFWKIQNRTENQPILIKVPDTNKNDHSTAEGFLYDNGKNGSAVKHFKISGDYADHLWPGSQGNKDLNASEEIWKFCSKYDINGRIEKSNKTYGVFIGMEDPSEIKGYQLMVVDAYYLDKKDIEVLHENNEKVYTYLDIGTIENFRDYYDDFKKHALKVYDDWPEEYWIDVSKKDWQEYLLQIATKYKEMGIDGFFLDNTDVYALYPSNEIYDGLSTIITDLNTLNLDIMINGGDVFVKKAVHNKDITINAINQETVFSKINFKNKRLLRNNQEDEDYYKEYLLFARDHNIDVYLLEYTKNEEIIADIKDYCDNNNFLYYISNSIELNDESN